MNQPLGLLRRTMAALLDLIIVGMSGFVLLSFAITPLYNSLIPDFPTKQEALIEYQVDSFIYYRQLDGVVTSYPYDSFSLEKGVYDYSDAVLDYYAVFKNGKIYPTSNLPFSFTTEWYQSTILKIDQQQTLFELVDVEGVMTITPKTSTTVDQLKDFYFQAYSDANDDLLTYPPFRQLRDELNGLIIQILLITVTLTVGFYYVFIPFLYGHGQTFMKRLFKIVVVNKDGYQLQTKDLLLRSLGTLLSFLALAISLEGTILVIYGIMAFTKFNRAPHDFFAMTKVMDGRSGPVFRNQEEKETFEKKLLENPS